MKKHKPGTLIPVDDVNNFPTIFSSNEIATSYNLETEVTEALKRHRRNKSGATIPTKPKSPMPWDNYKYANPKDKK